MRVTVYGDHINLAEELKEEWQPVARQAAREAGRMLTEEVRRLLRLRQGRRATAAPEGQPPELDFGNLLDSVSQLSVRMRDTAASSGVQVKHEGAARLEWGKTDRKGRRTFPHPFLRPALANVEGPITRMLEQRFDGSTATSRTDEDVVPFRGSGS